MVVTLIRKGEQKDMALILQLLYELGRHRPKSDQEANLFENKVIQYIQDSDKEIFVAEIDFKIIGLACVITLTRLNHIYPEMYIPELIVQENFQNQGIGSQLVAACLDLAKKENCFRIRLESGNERKESHKFYKKLGFKQTSLSFTKDLL